MSFPAPDRLATRTTWTGLRALCAWGTMTMAAAVCIFGTFGIYGLLPILVAALVYGTAAVTGIWIRNHERMDGNLPHFLKKTHAIPAMVMIGFGGPLIVTILFVHGPIGLWIALWLPLCTIQAVVALCGYIGKSFRILAGLSFVIVGIGLFLPGPLGWLAAMLWLLSWTGMLVSDRMARHTSDTVVEGRANMRDFLAMTGGSVVVPMALMLTLAIFFGGPTSNNISWGHGHLPGVGGWIGIGSLLHGGDATGGAGGGSAHASGGGSGPAATGRPPAMHAGDIPKGEKVERFFTMLGERFRDSVPGMARGAVVLLGLLVAWAIWRIWKTRRRTAGESEQTGEQAEPVRKVISARMPSNAPPDARGMIVYYYNKLRREIAPHGYQPLAHLTPDEYACHLSGRIPEMKNAVEELTGIFQKARYGASEPSKDDAGTVHKRYRSLQAFISSGRKS